MRNNCIELFILLILAPVAFTQISKVDGEADQILKRQQWFAEVRGLDFTPDARTKREAAMVATQQMIESSRSTGVPQVWTPIGPSPMNMLSWAMGRVAGRVTSLAVHPANEDTLYLGAAAGGLWKTNDGGANWVSLFDSYGTQTIGSIFIDPTQSDTVWVGTGEHATSCHGYFGLGLFRSLDGGTSFSQMNGSGLELSYISAIQVQSTDPDVIMVGGHGWCSGGQSFSGGLYRSTDGASNWTRKLTGRVTDIVTSINSPLTSYVIMGGDGSSASGIYKTVDGGQNFERLENGIPFGNSMGRGRIAISQADPQILYAYVNNWNTGKTEIYRTSNAGASWARTNADACVGQCSYNLCIDIHPTDPDRLLIGEILHYTSNNQGQTRTARTSTWGSAQTVHQDTHVVRYSTTNPNRYWVGTDGGLWRTDNAGASFSNLNGNLNISQFYDIAVNPSDPTSVFGGAQDNSSSGTFGDKIWDVNLVTGDGFMNLVDPANPNNVFQTSYPSGGPSLYRSTSGGSPGTFSYLFATSNGVSASDPWPWVTQIAIANPGPGSDTAVFLCSNRVYRSTNNGNQWQVISSNLTGSNNSAISCIEPTAVSGELVVYVGTPSGSIWRSDNATALNPEWIDVSTGLPGTRVSDIASDPSDATRVFATFSRFGGQQLYRTTDAGASWEQVGLGLPDVPANTVVINGDQVIVGNDTGIFESTDNGSSFQPLMEGMPQGMVVTDLEIVGSPAILTAGTFGRGAWQLELVLQLVTDAGPDLELCLGQDIQIQATSSNGTLPHSFQWSILSGPDPSLSQLLEPTNPTTLFTPSAHGIYVLQVQVTDGSDQEALDTVEVRVGDPIALANEQRVRWGTTSNSPSWDPDYDPNSNGRIEVQDILLQALEPNCITSMAALMRLP